MSKPLIIANWKCNPISFSGAKLLFDSVEKGVRNIKNVEVVICPPFHYLPVLNNGGRTSIKLGAQDCFWEEKGAFTGEISPKMLEDLGCQYVIIGHSERRKYFDETDEMINKKIKAALKFHIRPILCVGDKNRKSKEDIKEIAFKLTKDLRGLKKKDLLRLIICYEPIWAISTTKEGIEATPDDAMEGTLYIKKILYKLFGKSADRKIKILYGGSVDSKNIKSFISKAHMDGVLVGAASLKATEFVKLIKNASKI